MTESNSELFTHKGKVYMLTPQSKHSCGGCAAEHDDDLCTALPACRDVEKFYIFKEVSDHVIHAT